MTVAPREPDPSALRRGARLLPWLQWLLVIAGLTLMGWWAFAVADGALAQRAARRSLEAAPRIVRSAPRPPGASGRQPRPARALLRGAPLADLSIPRVGLSAVVLHGSDDVTLRRGPGHLENTALPGEPGNAVIAGHRDTFFRRLRHVAVGDDVFVDTPEGSVRYRVTTLRVVNPRDLSVLAATEDTVLTLITCYPFWVLGDAPDRFVVRAIRVDDPGAPGEAGLASTALPVAPARVASGAVAEAPARAHAPRAADDETLVRDAVERFRAAHNARVGSGRDGSAGRPLRFRSCDVTIDGGQATAACAAAPTDGGATPGVWRLALERDSGQWAIRTIEIP